MSSGGSRKERLHEWTLEARILADIFDRLGTLTSVEMQMGGNKPPNLHGFPRPITATQRLAKAETRRKHDDLSARLYPKGS